MTGLLWRSREPDRQNGVTGRLRPDPGNLRREAHLGRYLAEFDLRHNTREMNDAERAAIILKGGEGRRLTYRRTDKLAA